LRMAFDIWPSRGSGAVALALGGRCPRGGPPVVGSGWAGAAGAAGWAAAAASVHGSAVAGGATPIAAQRLIAAADATDAEAIRRRDGMTHLPRGLTSL